MTPEQLEAIVEVARAQERRTLDSQARLDLLTVLTTQGAELAALRTTVEGLPQRFELSSYRACISEVAFAHRQTGIAQQQAEYLGQPELLIDAARELAAFKLERPGEYAALIENPTQTDGENH